MPTGKVIGASGSCGMGGGVAWGPVQLTGKPTCIAPLLSVNPLGVSVQWSHVTHVCTLRYANPPFDTRPLMAASMASYCRRPGQLGHKRSAELPVDITSTA